MRLLMMVTLLTLAACKGDDEPAATDTGVVTVDSGDEDRDGDGVPASEDCDDDPAECGADCSPELTADDCDGYDNDCDDQVDEDNGASWYADCDGDGDFSATADVACGEPTTHSCDDGAAPDGGYTSTAPTTADCDDEDATQNHDDADGDGTSTCDGDCDDDPNACGSLCEPGNTTADTCDGFDVDCDGTIGEDDGRAWYPDCDGDGDPSGTGVNACDEPTTSPCTDGQAPDGGWTASVPSSPDCDDEDADLNHDDVDTDGESTCDGDCDDDPNACGADCRSDLTVDGCDGYDNDCDGGSDEDPDLTWYLDDDQDGSTVGTGTLQCTSPSSKHVSTASATIDCNDADAALNTRDDDGDGESTCAGDCDDDPNVCGDQCKSTNTLDGCDTYDNDCDGSYDEDPGSTVWYLDDDSDGWIASTTGVGQCTSPGAKYTTRLTTVDCNDGDASLNHDDADNDSVSTCAGDCDDDPNACGAACSPDLTVDACDGENNDCDNQTDEDPPRWFFDGDQDGWTSMAGWVDACDSPGAKYSQDRSLLTDCDDVDATANHDDEDGDNVSSCDGDCDDDPLACGAACSPDLNVDACDPNQYDNDCDDTSDEDAPTWFEDDDQDGWSADLTGQASCDAPGPRWSQTASAQADCDDDLASQNHDDADSDNHSTCDGDCDDDTSTCGAGCFPGNSADDICDDYNQDCDGDLDEDPDRTWFLDDDQDGWSADLTGQAACDSPGADWSQTASAQADCDDALASLNHDDADGDNHSTCDGDCDDDTNACGAGCFPENPAADVCDGDNQDCDSNVDENPEIDWFVDADRDGWTTTVSTFACVSPGTDYQADQSNPLDCDDTTAILNHDDTDNDGTSSCDGDCVDADANLSQAALDANLTAADIEPGASEAWYDGVDQDCLEDNDFDQDGDGYVATAHNSEAGGTAPSTGDCDDNPTDDASGWTRANETYPGANEHCDGLDNNCNGNIDESGSNGAKASFIPDTGYATRYTNEDVVLDEPGEFRICTQYSGDITVDSNDVSVLSPTFGPSVTGAITWNANRTGGGLERLKIDHTLDVGANAVVLTAISATLDGTATIDGSWDASNVSYAGINPGTIVNESGYLRANQWAIQFIGTSSQSGVLVHGTADLLDLYANGSSVSTQDGAILSVSSTGSAYLFSPIIFDNRAGTYGGAIATDGAVTIEYGNINGNWTIGDGANIYVGPEGSLNASFLVLDDHIGWDGTTRNATAASILNHGELTMNGGTISATNNASFGLRTTEPVTLTNTRFVKNRTGGILLTGTATAAMTSVYFEDTPDPNVSIVSCFGGHSSLQLNNGSHLYLGADPITVTSTCGTSCTPSYTDYCP
ncbi:MAG: hypothetical protein KC912_18940 [Proteobacteria bacterium]|nr:hypothetical protein [Pseudomonadota bacterium]